MVLSARLKDRAVPALIALVAALGLGLAARTAAAQPTAPAQRIASAPASPSSGGGGGAIPRVSIVARDYAFVAPATVPSGIVTYAMTNTGMEQHHAQFVRLNDGVTLPQLGAALMEAPEAAFALVSFTGGPSVIDPGLSEEVTLNLTAGQYAMLCFIESPDGLPHLAKGMFQPFQVAPPPSDASPPQATAEVGMRDFSFALPPLQGGQQTLRIVNQGPQPHEMVLFKADAPLEETLVALLNFEGEPPFALASVGGMQAMDAGQTAWFSANFTSGTYVMICFIPDPATGKSHAELGMVAPFVIP